MESKKTTELRGKKTSVRTKLAAAVAMLLVSTIMLTTTTYAWFVLSTAPEVKGMSTTVGSNGSLEIALLNDSTDTTKITSGVGDSVAVDGDAVRANTYWGNIVDLSSATYGLTNAAKAKLYPAALNLNDDHTKLLSNTNLLKTPTYGVDGRVNSIAANTDAGKYVDGTYQSKAGSYGVRLVGTVENADPKAQHFSNMKTSYGDNTGLAKKGAQNSLTNDGKNLINLVMKHGMNDSATFTADDVKTITNAVASLQTVAGRLKTAIQYAYEASRVAAGADAATNPEDVTMDTIKKVSQFEPYVTAYEALMKKLDGATIATNETGNYAWSEIKPALTVLIDVDGMTINDHTIAEVSTAAKAVKAGTATEEQKKLVNSLIKGPITAVVKTGAYSDVANFVDTYTSGAFMTTFEYNGLENDTSTTLQAQKNITSDTYVKTVDDIVDGLKAPEGNATPLITNGYGYIVDLAVRCNADTDLQLSATVNRVANDAATEGAGSTYTVGEDTNDADLKKVAQALRVVFINNQAGGYEILGVAGLTKTGTELITNQDNTYALHMYNWTVDANGGITLGNPIENDVITDMKADVAQCISVLVYLDGNYVDYAMGGVSGTLNLQFSSSTTLTPMDYTFTTANTTGLVITGDKTVVAGQKITNLAATYNGQKLTSGVTWSVTGGDATIVADTGVLTAGTIAGKVTVTATYTPEGAEKATTATYEIEVTAAAGT